MSGASIVLIIALAVCSVLSQSSAEVKLFQLSLSRGNINTNDPLMKPLALYTTIAIGTPEQKIKVQLDTGSDETWVPLYDHEKSKNNNLHYSNGYQADKSSTGKHENVNMTFVHRDVTVTAQPFTDIIAGLGNSAIQQRFLAARDASRDTLNGAPFDGIIGLAPVEQSTQGTESIMEQYRSDGNLNTHMAGLYINSKLDSSEGGEMTLGGLDATRFTGDIKYHYMATNSTTWSVKMQQVQVSTLSGTQERFSCRDGCTARFETGANDFIVGPLMNVQKLMSYFIRGEYSPYYDLHMISCLNQQRLPSLTFVIDHTKYVVTPNQYVRFLGSPEANLCYVAIRARLTGNDWILGTNFMSSYYTVFDYGQKRIGFASLKSSN